MKLLVLHRTCLRLFSTSPKKSEQFLEMFLKPNHKLQAQPRIEQMTGRGDKETNINNDITNRLAIRTPRQEGMPVDQDWPSVWPAAASFRSSVVPLPVRMGGRSIMKYRLIRQQFGEIIKNGGEARGKEFLEKLIQSEIVENVDIFLEELVYDKLAKGDYGGAFTTWSRYATIERTVAGVDQLLKYILREQKDIQSVRQSRIKAICDKIQQLFTPSDAFAECVSAYLANDLYNEAKVLADFYVISPRSFIKPIRRLVYTNDEKLLDQFIRLFNEIYITNNVPKQADATSEEDLRVAHEQVKFLLQTNRKKKKFVLKKPKVKKYNVDLRALDILMRVVDENLRYRTSRFVENIMKDDLEVPSANQWGRKRADFYVGAHSRIREDGHLNNEEQELLELEENDALERQHKMDSINAIMDPKKLASFADVSDGDVSEDDAWTERKSQQKLKFSAPSTSGQFRRIRLSKKKPAVTEQLQQELELDNKQGKKRDNQDKKRDNKQDAEHRQIGYDIQKNKGLLQKRKKEARHSRVKRRAQYKKALIKRRSQVPDVKRETSKYSGEARGIRMSTVRSVSFKN
ncbi:28S ribosomal protein S35, mitochondrial [Aphelenchoides bicaudatus]|nr:28S ribosomal protein S35, mitochondrial [Aphelenchoides bicaudatus]